MNWPCPTFCCFSTLNFESLKVLLVSKPSPFSYLGPKASTSSCELILCVCQMSWNRDIQVGADFIVGIFNAA